MRTFVLLAVRARPNAVINSASAKPGGPTATLSIVGLDKCIHAAAATVLVTATATIKTIHRQPLLTKPQHCPVHAPRDSIVTRAPAPVLRKIKNRTAECGYSFSSVEGGAPRYDQGKLFDDCA